MDIKRKWVFERIAAPGEADGRACIFCSQEIVEEGRPAHWVEKAVEDNQDADFVVADGYAHFNCHEEKLASQRKGRFTLPEVPEGPRGS